MVRIAPHHIKGTPENVLSAALRREVDYTPVCAWPDDCTVQWGNGIVPRNPFFEAFPADGGFIRGDADTIEAAERAAFAKFEREQACVKHFWSRWHPRRGTYLNTGAHCRRCGCFKSGVFREVVVLGRHRKPLSRCERDHMQSMEGDQELNEYIDAKYPERRAERAAMARRLKIRLHLYGVDESRFGFFD